MNKLQILTRDQLKWVAMITMIIDHIGYCFIPADTELFFTARSIIGRLAMPIFAVLIS